MGQTVGGTQECQPHSLVIHRYRLGHSPVGTLCYKTLVFYKVAFPAQCTVGPTQAKSDVVVETQQLVSECSCCDRGELKVILGKQWIARI